MDLLKAYFQLDDRDDGQRMREKLTGRLLGLDPALAQPCQPSWPSWRCRASTPPGKPSTRRNAASIPWRPLDAVPAGEPAKPLLLVFENLHWIDAETHAFLDGLVERLTAARLLLLVNYRPEYQHGWSRHPFYTQLRSPLPQRRGHAAEPPGGRRRGGPAESPLDRAHPGQPLLPGGECADLGGNAGVGRRVGGYHLANANPTIQVPATVQAVLAARIDRPPPEEKALMQTTAVIGTEVPLALLQAVAEAPEAALRLGLTHLQAAEFLCETRLFSRGFVYLHARPHPAGGLRDAAPTSGARDTPASSRPWRPSPGTGGRIPCPVGRGVGQGHGVRPTGGGEGPGAVGPP